MKINSKVKLNNETEIPILGLGTWSLLGKQVKKAILWALDTGYRLFDTATIYENEKEIGEALKISEIPREEIFITTKVWKSDHGYTNTLRAFEKSLKSLGLDYIDLYLIHWPDSELRNETWKALEKIYSEGKARAIGVSNYTIRHLKELLEIASYIPVVNQVEFSPFLYQKDLFNFCKGHKIVIEAYSPLTRRRRFDNNILIELAQKYSKTVPQILIRWGLQHEVIEIPKSGNKEHIQQNTEIFDFEISDDDMSQLDNLNDQFRIGDDPHFMD
ncbi:MAG: aldo/keto reductase [Promethearchaeota archaeon]